MFRMPPPPDRVSSSLPGIPPAAETDPAPLTAAPSEGRPRGERLPLASAMSRLRSLIGLVATIIVGMLLLSSLAAAIPPGSRLIVVFVYLSVWFAVAIFFLGASCSDPSTTPRTAS